VWILKYGTILNTPRNFLSSKSKTLKELLSCSLCLGFWVGVLFGYLEYHLNGMNPLYVLYLAFSSAAVCWFFDILFELITLSCDKIDPK
jgi:hypothetical protein